MIVTTYLLVKYIILGLMPYFRKEIIILISIFLIGSILIIAIYYMINLNKLSKLGKEPEQEPQQQTSQESFKDKREDFNKYLKDVADKGLKTMQQEKLAKAREQAQNREAQKFNKTTETKVTREANEYNNEMEQE